MASTAITQLIERARRIQTSQANARKRSREKTQEVYEAACQLAGGAVGGLVDGYLSDGEEHAIWGVPTALTGGAIVAALGLADLLPASPYVASLGLGAASYGLGNLVRDKVAAA